MTVNQFSGQTIMIIMKTMKPTGEGCTKKYHYCSVERVVGCIE